MSVEGTVTILLDRQKASVNRVANETLLESARRAGLTPPFSCEAGNCGTCMAKLIEGNATMRVNDALDDDEVEEGYMLTCQAVPDTESVTVEYELSRVLVESRRRSVLGLVAGDADRAAHQPEIARGDDHLGVCLERLGQGAHRGGRNPERPQPRFPALRGVGGQRRGDDGEHLVAARGALGHRREAVDPRLRGERPPEPVVRDEQRQVSVGRREQLRRNVIRVRTERIALRRDARR